MGRKKTRTITVEGTTYAWRVAPLNPSYVLLKVWRGPQDKRPLRVRFRYDNPWFHLPELAAGEPARVKEVFQTLPITPYAVRTAIEGALELGWDEGDKPAPFDIEWQDGEFARTENAADAPLDHYDESTGAQQAPPSRGDD